MFRAVAFLYSFLYFVQARLDSRKDRGATAVEYGLLVGLIAIILIAGAGLLGTQLNALFTRIAGIVGGGGGA